MPNIAAYYLASCFHIQEALSLNFCQHAGYFDEVFCPFLQSLQGLYTKMCLSLFLPQSSKVIMYHDFVTKLCIIHTGDTVSLNKQVTTTTTAATTAADTFKTINAFHLYNSSNSKH